MLHITPPTKGRIAGAKKEAILSRMFEKSQGYLKAAKAEGFSAARAQGELRADPAFHSAVSAARISIAERLMEDYIALADELKARPDDHQAIAVRLKARQF